MNVARFASVAPLLSCTARMLVGISSPVVFRMARPHDARTRAHRRDLRSCHQTNTYLEVRLLTVNTMAATT